VILGFIGFESLTDRLYTVAQSQRISAGITGVREPSVISSLHGHDGFLIETETAGKIVAGLLEE